MLNCSRKIKLIANSFCFIKKVLSVKINSFSSKETLKDDKLIKDVLENIKTENKEKMENKENNSSSEKDDNLGAKMKDVGGDRSQKEVEKKDNYHDAIEHSQSSK